MGRTSGLPKSYQEYLKAKHPPFAIPSTRGAANCRRLYFWAGLFPCGILMRISYMICTKLNSRFGLALRMPWVICKFTHLYKWYVMKTFLETVTEDLLRIPNGYKNADSLGGGDAAVDDD